MTTQRKADLLLVLITGFWGCSYYLSDLALEEMPPFALCAVRFLLAFALLGIVLFPKLRHVNRKTLLWAVPAGLSLTLTYIGATAGLLYTSISNAGFICSLPAVTTPLLTFLVYRKRPERRMLLCLVLCTVGLGLLTLGNDFRRHQPPGGGARGTPAGGECPAAGRVPAAGDRCGHAGAVAAV